MSRLTVWIHGHFGTTTPETAAQIIERLLGPVVDDVKQYVEEIVGMMAMTGGVLSSEQQRGLAAQILKNALKSVFHVDLPDVAINWLIEEAWLVLSGGKSKTNPLPIPSPVSDDGKQPTP